MENKPIPEDVKKQIDGAVEIRFSKRVDNGDGLADDKYYYFEGMLKGYSLAASQISKLEGENQFLRKQIELFQNNQKRKPIQ